MFFAHLFGNNFLVNRNFTCVFIALHFSGVNQSGSLWLISRYPAASIAATFRILSISIKNPCPCPLSRPYRLVQDFTAFMARPVCDAGQVGFFADLKSNCRSKTFPTDFSNLSVEHPLVTMLFFNTDYVSIAAFFHCGEDQSKRHFACPGNMLFDEQLMRCQDPVAGRLHIPKDISNVFVVPGIETTDWNNVNSVLLWREQNWLRQREKWVVVAWAKQNFQWRVKKELISQASSNLEGNGPVGFCSRGIGAFADIQSGCRNFFTCHPNGSLTNQTCPALLLFNEKSLVLRLAVKRALRRTGRPLSKSPGRNIR